MSRMTVLVGAPLLGAVLGIAGAFVHAARSAVFGVSVPWGLVLSFLCVVFCVRAATVLAGVRSAGVLLFLGWLLPTVVSALQSTDGDLGLQANWRSTVYLFGTVIVASTLMVLRPPVGEHDAR